jgi:DNA-binding Lrp family transcriptional regulator
MRMAPPEAGRDGAEARIVQAIKEHGPRNVALISRLTGVPSETVRYKIRRQLTSLGFRYHAEPNYGRLGLSLHWARLGFEPGFSESASLLLKRLNELGYLVYYARVIPSGSYVSLFAMPPSLVPEYRSLLDYVAELGVLRKYEMEEVTFSQHYSFDPKYFNFRSGQWEVDWRKVALEGPPSDIRPASPPAAIDRYDLLLVKELQIDSLRHDVEIAKKLGVAPPSLGYHMRAHVEREGLIDRYMVRWTQDVTKTLAHAVMLSRVTVRGLDELQLPRALEAIGKVPFTWSVYLLKDGITSTMCIPVEESITTFDFLQREMADFSSAIELEYIKSTDAKLFTIPYNMYEGKWTSGVERLRPSIVSMVEARKRKT